MGKNIFLSVLLLTAVLVGCTPQQEVKATDSQPIAKPKAAVRQGPAIEIIEKEIDLGTIPHNVEEIVGYIQIANVGSAPLRINKVDGPCKCFAGYESDDIIEPGQGSEIKVKFTKSKIPSGDVDRMVMIKSNDRLKAASEVHFKFFVERDPTEEELRRLNSEVARMRSELRAMQKDVTAIMEKLDVKAGTAKKKKAVDKTVYKVDIGSSPIKGDMNAPVTIVEFTDFQCPYCIKEIPKLTQIMSEFPGKVKLVYKHHPLAFHKEAKPAHAAAELAKLQGGNEMFWKMHDMIAAEPKHLHVEDLRGYAEKLEMNLELFDDVMADSKQIDELLKTDMDDAKKYKVTKTPTIMINGLKMTGRNLSNYRARIQEELKKAEAAAVK